MVWPGSLHSGIACSPGTSTTDESSARKTRTCHTHAMLMRCFGRKSAVLTESPRSLCARPSGLSTLSVPRAMRRYGTRGSEGSDLGAACARAPPVVASLPRRSEPRLSLSAGLLRGASGLICLRKRHLGHVRLGGWVRLGESCASCVGQGGAVVALGDRWGIVGHGNRSLHMATWVGLGLTTWVGLGLGLGLGL